MMNKVIVLGDLHIGARDGRSIFHDHFSLFFSDVLLPYCKNNNINTIIQLGDTYDRRKFIDFTSIKQSEEYLFNLLKPHNITMYMLVGNHDIALRNSLKINSPSLLLQKYDNIHIIDKPTEMVFGNTNILMLPWICSENQEECFASLENTKSEICMGHLEIQGFLMNAGMSAKTGISSNIFRKFDAVYSGHYHHRSSYNNIHYVGTPYELNFMDCENTKGFHVLNTDTRDVEFIKNPYKLFTKIVYDDTLKDYSKIDVSDYKGMFVKLIIKEKKDLYKFDIFIDRLYNCGAYDIKVVEDINDIITSENEENIIVEDTVTILKHYVDNSNIDENIKDEVSSFIRQLYLEALDVTI